MSVDKSGNYNFNWFLCDGKYIPVLNSTHLTFGFSFNMNDYLIALEGYLKHTSGITRELEINDNVIRYNGNGETKGLDFFIKKDFKNQTFWISYTLSKSEEYFPYFPTNEYIPAFHDQRHELKLAGMANIKSFYFSSNFVYGSGFPDPDQLPDNIDYIKPYNRLDIALIYKILSKKVKIDAGISVLNVLNKENIKFSNFIKIPTDETESVSIYAEPIPFTPTLFLHIFY